MVTDSLTAIHIKNSSTSWKLPIYIKLYSNKLHVSGQHDNLVLDE